MFSYISILLYFLADLSCRIRDIGRRETTTFHHSRHPMDLTSQAWRISPRWSSVTIASDKEATSLSQNKFGWKSSKEEQSAKHIFCFAEWKDVLSFQLEPICHSYQGISVTHFLLKKEHNEPINQTLKQGWKLLQAFVKIQKGIKKTNSNICYG